MAMQGMDIGEVRQLAQALVAAASELNSMVSTLTKQVQSAHWVGPDRERFVGDWNSHHASALKNVAHALDEAGNRAKQDAQHQEDASNA
jgi:uncharacterized protein YukE